MIKVLSVLFFAASAWVVTIYSLSVADTDNNTINFNNYRDKKILIVNTATGCPSAAQQFVQLQQLYQQHHDSLIIIAFPTNSFGNEPGTNEHIRSLMRDSFGVTFPIAAKSWVTGDSANIVYQWLGSKLQNDVMSARTRKNFQKFLVDGSGMLVAQFDSSVSPVSTVVQNAIANY